MNSGLCGDHELIILYVQLPIGKPARNRKGRTPGPRARRRRDESDDDDDFEKNTTRLLRTPRSAARIPKNKKGKSTASKRKNLPVFESDSEDEVDLLDLDQRQEDQVNESENTNPNVGKKHKSTSHKQKRGLSMSEQEI